MNTNKSHFFRYDHFGFFMLETGKNSFFINSGKLDKRKELMFWKSLTINCFT